MKNERTETVYMRRQRKSLLYKTLIFKLKQKWITFQIFECNASDAPLSTNQHIQFTAWAPASKQSFNDDLLTVGTENNGEWQEKGERRSGQRVGESWERKVDGEWEEIWKAPLIDRSRDRFVTEKLRENERR